MSDTSGSSRSAEIADRSSKFDVSGPQSQCPTCGRVKDGDCRISPELVICHLGVTHHPPKWLKSGDVIDGRDQQRWAYTGESRDGRAAIFTLDKPRNRSQLVSDPPTHGSEMVSQYSETFLVCRFPGKKVRPLTFVNGSWIWKGPTGKRPLLNLDQLRARADDPVLVLEGEPTCGAGAALFPDHVAVTWSGGCKSLQKTDFTPLAGRKVLLWPDNDEAGRMAMRQLAVMLRDVGAASVMVVANPPDAPRGWDLADADWTPQQAAAWAEKHTEPMVCVDPAPTRQDHSDTTRRIEKQLGATRLREQIETLDSFADELLASSIPALDRLIHVRHQALDLGLSLRDSDLQRKLWEASRRRAGAIEMLGPGMAANVEPENWLWQGVILARDSTLLVSEPKVGKTTLLINAISCLYRGESELLGLPFYGPCPPVIIVGTDMPQTQWLRLLHRFGLAEPAGGNSLRLLPDGPIRGLFSMDAPIHLDSGGIARLADLSSKHPGSLLLLDSYAKLTAPLGLKEASSDFAGPLGDLQEAVAPYTPSLAVVHHSGRSRAGEGAVAASRGTTALPAAVSHCVALSWLNRGKGTNDNRVVLQTEGRGSEPLQLLIEQHEDGWASHGDAGEVFRELRMADAEEELHDRQAAALELVRERWEQDRQRTTSGDVIEALGLRGSNAAPIARRTLQQLAKRALVESSKETTSHGQVVWFWPAGQQEREHPPARTVPPVRPVRPVPSDCPPNPQTPYGIGEGTLRTHKAGGTVQVESAHLTVRTPSLSIGAPVGSGADVFDDEDAPAWGPRPHGT